VKQVPAPDYAFVQYHGQSAGSTLHLNLVRMWAAIHADTGGRVSASLHAENGKVAGGDPVALRMLIAGEIQFYTLMGGIIGTVVPVAEVQQVPFAFGTAAQAHKAIDGPLGRMIGEEMAAKGMYLFPHGGFDNGMRQVASVRRAVAAPDDLAGMRIRVPPGQLIFDTFQAFGAEPVIIPAYQLHDALATGRVMAQENPLAVLDGFKLYQLVKYVSMTNHMWSGFNLMSHLATWQRLPDDIRGVIERNAAVHVRAQRADQRALNARLRRDLARRGLAFNDVEQAAFRARLAGVYSAWRERLGARCWSLLEAEVGKLG
jgi:tripartite ATP-independent transporter DctP family solute receptor